MIKKGKTKMNETKAQFYYARKIEYSTIPNKYLKDKNLSLKAKGLLTIMYALPEEWDYTIQGLQTITGKGEKQITNILKELIEKYYITRTQKRRKKAPHGAFSFILPRQCFLPRVRRLPTRAKGSA